MPSKLKSRSKSRSEAAEISANRDATPSEDESVFVKEDESVFVKCTAGQGTAYDGRMAASEKATSYSQPVNGCGISTPQSESVSATIAGLESLAETLPAVLQVANGWAPEATAFRNRDVLLSAIGMLQELRDNRARVADSILKSWEREREQERELHHARRIEAARTEGIALGIEQEKQRVKEARRGRKH